MAITLRETIKNLVNDHLKSKKGKKTSQSVLNKVEESQSKGKNVLSEEFNKMKHLIVYNKKTQ